MSTGQADSAPSVDNQPDAFDEAMAEFAGEGSAPTDDVAGKQPEDQGEPPIDDQASPPADPAGGTEPPAGNAAPDGEPTDDVWKDVPEAARTAWDQAQATIASLKGRASAEARRANQFAQQLAQVQQPQGGNGQQQGQTGGQPASKPNDLMDSEELRQFQDEYPEIAKPVTDLIAKLAGRLDQLAAPVESIAQAQVHADHQARYDALAATHPDWQTYATDDRWGEFLAKQPRFIQDMHQRNLDVSDPDEAAFVLSRFKEYVGAPVTPAANGRPTPAPTPSADPRRQRQLDAGRDAGSTGAGATPTGIPADDFDAAVGIFAERADRQLASSKR